MEAILEAGGFTKLADQNDVVVRRKDGDKVSSLEVKAKTLSQEGDLAKTVDLKAGYVLVEEAFF